MTYEFILSLQKYSVDAAAAIPLVASAGKVQRAKCLQVVKILSKLI